MLINTQEWKKVDGEIIVSTEMSDLSGFVV